MKSEFYIKKVILFLIVSININCSNAINKNNMCCFKKKKSQEDIKNISSSIENNSKEISPKSTSNKNIEDISSESVSDKSNSKLERNENNKLELPILVLHSYSNNKKEIIKKNKDLKTKERSLSLDDKDKIKQQNSNALNPFKTDDIKSEDIVLMINSINTNSK